MTTTAKHKILIVGGGTAGITVAARLLRKGETDVAVIEPADQHYYQAMWTLVGGGRADVNSTERSEASVMPKKATWIRNSAVAFDPDNNVVECADGARYSAVQYLDAMAERYPPSQWTTTCRSVGISPARSRR